MKILYYDCFAGISGDMNLGALIDLGIPKDYLVKELAKLNVKGYKIELGNELKMGISGTKANVILDSEKHGHHHNKKHEHRNLADIEKIIDNSSLNDRVKTKSKEILKYIAEAEAKIHSKSIDKIHFHEVGATDSIIDIVGAAVCIDYLKPDKIMASTIELGGGFVHCAHGVFPVPAPATAEILKDIPVKKGKVDKETTTPTGAAILKAYVDEFIDNTAFTIIKTGYGIGHHDLEIPNVLRVYICVGAEEGIYNTAEAILIECNIDDMNPEHYDYIIEKLFNLGAQDVYLVPIIMKKSRPANQLSVLCDEKDRKKIEEFILMETSSLGLRYQNVTKAMLKREIINIETKYGPIRIKTAYANGKPIKHKAEYDDCAAAAKKYGVSLKEIYTEIDKCYNA
ncbi:MAG: nickel pincer cofactor biosynthesis protein LarC [Bacteroidales bacterium]|nr:nickel pincer cofactor biosynthesis protein LarC [Bacteroidales bacterium]